MRVVVFAICLGCSFLAKANGDSCDDLLADECKGSAEVQPIMYEKEASRTSKISDFTGLSVLLSGIALVFCSVVCVLLYPLLNTPCSSPVYAVVSSKGYCNTSFK